MILIAGDSWACGEWRDNHFDSSLKDIILHGGLSQYLRESGHLVTNLGRGGGSNLDSYTQLANFLTNNPDFQSQVTCIIVFQTSWDRDLKYMNNIELIENFNQGYVYGRERLISRFYHKLMIISSDFDVPVYVIGGLTDTLWMDQFSKEYPGVSIVCRRLTNLLLNSNPYIDRPVYSVFLHHQVDTLEKIKKLINQSDISILLTDMQDGLDRLKLLKSNKHFFWPDGYHPNRLSHQILFNYLNDLRTFKQ